MDIENGEILYRYAKPKAFPEDQAEFPAYSLMDNNLSCDWAKYQGSPEDSIHVTEGKNLIVAICICDEVRNPRNPKGQGEIVAEWKQNIFHDPLEYEEGNKYTPNYAHSLIQGKKKAAVLATIRENSSMRIVERGKAHS